MARIKLFIRRDFINKIRNLIDDINKLIKNSNEIVSYRYDKFKEESYEKENMYLCRNIFDDTYSCRNYNELCR